MAHSLPCSLGVGIDDPEAMTAATTKLDEVNLRRQIAASTLNRICSLPPSAVDAAELQSTTEEGRSAGVAAALIERATAWLQTVRGAGSDPRGIRPSWDLCVAGSVRCGIRAK